MEEYSDQPANMIYTYCEQISPSEYERQGATETEKALNELMEYVEDNPLVYRKVLVRQKQEEAENAGVFSYMKCKVLAKIKGPDYMEDAVSTDETLFKIGQLQHQLAKVYDYGQEAAKSSKRFSRRIAAKKAAKENKENVMPAYLMASSSSKHAVPPCPAYPPASSPMTSGDDDVFFKSVLSYTPKRRPPIHPDNSTPPPPLLINGNHTSTLKDVSNNQVALESPTYKSTPKQRVNPRIPLTPEIYSKLRHSGSSTSMSSLSSVCNELRSFDKAKLKSTKLSTRSPKSKSLILSQGRKHLISASLARESITDLCRIPSIRAFNQQLVDKFRNARSPVIAVSSPVRDFNSPTGFTP